MNVTKIECSDGTELNALKEKAMKSKLISLDKMGKHPLSNPSYFSKKDKEELAIKMNDIFVNWDDETITNEFNKIVNDNLLASKKDYNTYPIYDLSKSKTESIP